MRIFLSRILVLFGALVIVYIFWGADIQEFFVDRGVVSIPTFITFVFNLFLWLTEKAFLIGKNIAGYILELFNNILSNIVKLADLLTGVLNILKKISEFVTSW